VEVFLYALLTYALYEGEWSESRSGSFTLRERASGTKGMEKGAAAGLEVAAKSKIPVRAGKGTLIV
jgi:hypothetical protein